MAADFELAAVLKFVNDAQGQIAGAVAELKKLGDVEDEVEEKTSGLEKGVQLLRTAFSAMAVRAVVKTALELGKLGLQAGAVEERFVALAGGTQEADAYLRAIAESTNNTVDRMGAMTATSKLLSMGLVDNAQSAGKMIEMAVRLGDQTQAANGRIADFAAMLANQSTPRLDNYGMSSANTRARIIELQAATAGLSREQAFSQAVMEEGERALTRLGDAGLGQAQSVDQLSAAWSDLRVNIGLAYAPAAGGIAGAAAKVTRALSDQQSIFTLVRRDLIRSHGWLAGTVIVGFENFRDVLGATNTELDKYQQRMDLADLVAEQKREHAEMMEAAMLTTKGLAGGMEVLEKASEVTGKAIAKSSWGVKRALRVWMSELRTTKIEVGELSVGMKMFKVSTEAMGKEIGASKEALSGLHTVMAGELGKELNTFAEKQSEARQRVAELNEKILELTERRYLTAEQSEELAALQTELGEVQQSVEDNALAHEDATRRILFGYMEQRLAIDGLTREELAALQAVAEKWGLMDSATYSAIEAIDAAATSVENGYSSWDGFIARADLLDGKLRNLPSHHDFTLDYHIKYFGQQAERQAAGGDYLVTRPTLFLAGEAGPERATFIPQGQPGFGGASSASAPVDRRSYHSEQGGDTFNIYDAGAAALLMERKRRVHRDIARGF